MFDQLEVFFFRPIPSRGWRLMRRAWGVTLITIMLPQWPHLAEWYAAPGNVGWATLMHPWRFSLLDYLSSPPAVRLVWLMMILAAMTMALERWPRIATIVASMLFFSFTERNLTPFHAEATVMRLVGFLLILAPTKEDHMPIWPYRLLLWQVVVLYVSAGWYKALNPYWSGGTGFLLSLTSEWSVFPRSWLFLIEPWSRLLNHFTIWWELAWIALLIPHAWQIRRFMLVSGLVFHLLIGVCFPKLMTFSLAMLTMYFGLLEQENIYARKV